MFWCDACDTHHWFNENWNWNGSETKPTVTPSILVNKDGPGRCHLNITDGKLCYYDDCSHAKSGMTVEMEDV